jgi:hypothetical protein
MPTEGMMEIQISIRLVALRAAAHAAHCSAGDILVEGSTVVRRDNDIEAKPFQFQSLFVISGVR